MLTHAHLTTCWRQTICRGDTIAPGAADVPLLTDPMYNLSGLWSSPFVCKSAAAAAGWADLYGLLKCSPRGHTKGGICPYDWQEKTLFFG